MSAKNTKQRTRKTKGMKARMGPAQTYMNVESKGKYARGKKKGARRARRRVDKEVIEAVEE